MGNDKPALTVADCRIKINGTDLPSELKGNLQNVIVIVPECGMARLQATFTASDQSIGKTAGTIDWDRVSIFGGGAKVELLIKLDSRVGTVFSGELTNVRVRSMADGPVVLSVEAADKLHRFSRNTRQRVLMDVGDADVLSKLAQENGLSAETGDAPSIVYPSVFQFNMTDLELLKDRADRLGFIYWVDDGKLNFSWKRKKGDSYKFGWGKAWQGSTSEGEELLEAYVVRTAGRVNPSVTVRGWDTKAKAPLESALTYKSDLLYKSQIYKKELDRLSSAFSDPKLTFGMFTATSDKLNTQVAKGRLLRSVLGFFVVKGRVRGYPLLKPGCEAEMSALPGAPDGVYSIVNVIHEYDLKGLITYFEARPVDPGSPPPSPKPQPPPPKPSPTPKPEEKKKKLSLDPQVPSATTDQWSGHHHALLFVRMKVENGSFDQIKFTFAASGGLLETPIPTGIWKLKDPGGPWNKPHNIQTVVGNVGDKCHVDPHYVPKGKTVAEIQKMANSGHQQMERICGELRHGSGDFSSDFGWSWYKIKPPAKSPAQRKIVTNSFVLQRQFGEGTYIIAIYPRFAGSIKVSAYGVGKDSSLGDDETVTYSGHPAPGD